MSWTGHGIDSGSVSTLEGTYAPPWLESWHRWSLTEFLDTLTSRPDRATLRLCARYASHWNAYHKRQQVIAGTRPHTGVHGFSGYTQGCRCDVCRRGMRNHHAARRLRAKQESAA